MLNVPESFSVVLTFQPKGHPRLHKAATDSKSGLLEGGGGRVKENLEENPEENNDIRGAACELGRRGE